MVVRTDDTPTRGSPSVAVGRGDDAVSPCSCSSTSLYSVAGEIILLRVGGEVDAFTIPGVSAAITSSLDRRPSGLVVDLATLTFCCGRGLALLVETRATADKFGTGYAVSGMPSSLERIWMMLWDAADLPLRYRSAAAAVMALRPPAVTVRG